MASLGRLLEREVAMAEDGVSYLMQVRPYRDLNNVIDGASSPSSTSPSARSTNGLEGAWQRSSRDRRTRSSATI